MFSWLTGPRIANLIEDIEPDPANDTTFIDPPDTPAPQFAVKAFKHALFGTPAPQERDTATATKIERENAKSDTSQDAARPNLPAPKEDSAPTSPSKRNGILMTPGTASKGRKTVSFGAHVVDNEGKRGGTLRSGVPNDCPGKFPSPWTPGTELKVTDKAKAETDSSSGTRPRTKLTAALYNARSAEKPTTKAVELKPKAKDDSDITLDLGTPRSESGKYWKEQFESYAARSEKEMKKLVTKQQLAKNYAKKKDAEAIEALTRLGEERKRFRLKERQLEQQNKGLQEQLQQTVAEKDAAKVEIAALKQRLAAMEKRLTTSSSQEADGKVSLEIYEDSIKNSSLLYQEQDRKQKALAAASGWRHPHSPTEDKENSPPEHLGHRKTLSESTADISTNISRVKSTTDSEKLTLPAPTSSRIPPSPLRVRRIPHSESEISIIEKAMPRDAPTPKSPTVHLPSSPLPQPSPDPWTMEMNDSPAPAMDRMALPISTGGGFGGGGYERASVSRTSRLAMRNRGTGRGPVVGRSTHRSEPQLRGDAAKMAKATTAAAVAPRGNSTSSSQQGHDDAKTENSAKTTISGVEGSTTATPTATMQRTNSKTERSTAGGAKVAVNAVALEGSTSLGASTTTKAMSSSSLPLDRKEEAKRRLQERKERKQRQLAASRLSEA